MQDYGLLKQELPPEIPWFKQFIVRLDLGFQGFKDLYPCKNLYIPIKKQKATKIDKKELNQEQKEINKEQAKHRIIVEHSIGGMKRYRILVNRNRIKNKSMVDRIIGVCAALWNYSIES